MHSHSKTRTTHPKINKLRCLGLAAILLCGPMPFFLDDFFRHTAPPPSTAKQTAGNLRAQNAEQSQLPAPLAAVERSVAQLFVDPGRGLRDAHLLVELLPGVEANASPAMLLAGAQAAAYFVLAQDYKNALVALDYLDKAVRSNSELREDFSKLLRDGAGRIPASSFLSAWEVLLQIPALQLQVGNVLSAKLWLADSLPSLTSSREVLSAALLLVAVLSSESRYTQAKTLLEQRFLQPLRAGELPAFADRALMLGHFIAKTSSDAALETEVRDFLNKHFRGSPAQLYVADSTKLGLFPSPYFLLPALDSISLGLLEYQKLSGDLSGPALSPAEDSQASAIEVPQTQGSIASQLQSRYIQIGSFRNLANAERIVELSSEKGFAAEIVSAGDVHRALIPVGSEDAQVLLIRLKEAGIEGFRVDD